MLESFDFWVRATLGDTTRIDSDLTEFLLDSNGGATVAIRTIGDQPFRDSSEIQLRGGCYSARHVPAHVIVQLMTLRLP